MNLDSCHSGLAILNAKDFFGCNENEDDSNGEDSLEFDKKSKDKK